MKIENTFTVDAPIQDAWELLTNIAEIAPCLPGAKLTDEVDGVYSGGVKIKVGPVTSEYKGSAEFVEKDDVNYKAVINGKGRDTRGAGNAQALITAQMTALGDKTQVDIETDLKVSGKVAQFGRGVMQDVSTKLLGQFAECLEAKIGEPAAIDDIAEASAEATEAGIAETDESIIDKATDAVEDVVAAVADKVGDLGGAAAAGVSAAASKITGKDDDDDDGVLDLLDVAGGAVFKRFLPVLVVAIVLVLIIIWLIAS
jgi:carbon monoxide dehydrogenase subunit G